MRGIRAAWLWWIVLAEVVGIAGLLTWVLLTHPGQKPAKQSTTNTHMPTAPVTYKTPVIKAIEVGKGFSEPTVIATPKNDKRLFIAEQGGVIRILDADGKTEPTPFLDISSKVQNNGEMGLLGLVFHPNYAKNGYFYVDYVDKNQNTIIARYTAKQGVADPSSEKVLLSAAQPYVNHNGGQLQFGPDGFLYIAFGDGGSAGDPENRAQNKGVVFGKLLRIDVDHGDPYSVPATNPFVKDASAKPEVWAYGLRNPWRFSFDHQTGDLYIGDVGQSAVEEIDMQKASSKGGENYGWRCFEGSQPYNSDGCQDSSNYTKPIIEYTHTDNRCSVTGGYVYRGSAQPALKGKYFYGDYCGGQLYYAEQVKDAWQSTTAATGIQGISTFGEGSDGELYIATHEKGTILHITDTAN